MSRCARRSHDTCADVRHTDLLEELRGRARRRIGTRMHWASLAPMTAGACSNNRRGLRQCCEMLREQGRLLPFAYER